MKGHLRLIRRLFFVLCALVVLNAGAFSACADDEELLEKSGEIIAHNAISDTEDQEEILTIVASGEKEEKKEEELLPVAVSEEGKEEKKEESLPDEPGEDIDSEEGNLLESTDPTDESMPLEEKNQTEEKDAIPTEDDDIKNEQGKEDAKPAENGQEDDQTERQEEITVIESEEKAEDPVPPMVMLFVPKRGSITEDNQEKTEEPLSEDPVLRNTKGSTGYTVAISIDGNPTFKKDNYFIFASAGGIEYKQSITGSNEDAIILPNKPERIFIADPDGWIIDELQATNGRYYIIPTPEFDEVNRKCIYKIIERLDCRMQFSKLISDLQISGKYYVVVKRRRSGTPIACALINNGIPEGFDSANIYNDPAFVIYKTDSFNFDYYKRNPNSYSQYILKPDEETDNGVVFSWSSEPELVNGSYVYYICADKKKEPETEERWEHGTVTIYNTDQDGTELCGSTFKLYADADCENEISTYTGGSFTIYTGEESLTGYLPDGTENNNTKTYYLKETAAPTGYQRDENTHPVVISASITRFTDEEQNKIVIKTSYGITIDSVAAISITNQIQTKAITENASVTVTNRDQDGAELSGSTFKLYAEAGCTTEIGSYTDESFMINTGDESLTNYLPDGTENNNTKTFYLKEMVAPNGYKGDENTHRVVITATITRYPDEKEDKIVVKTSYVITIDGVETIDIENTKLTGTERVDRIITIVNKDDSGNELNGSSFGLYSNEGCTAAIVTYTGERFTIGTDETALINYLPTETGADNARTLYLKQIAAPAGYDTDIIVHTVVITKVIDTYLDNEAKKFITRTTYEITVDNENTIDITNPKRTKEECVHGNATVTTKNEAGEALSGLTFRLYPSRECAENTEIATYSAQSFIISTNLDALESHLPTGTGAENATTLYLKQMVAPAGYNADTAKHRVVITKAESTDFVVASNTYVTTTTYGITIDGESRIEITNTKRTDKERVDGSITVTAKDQDGAALAGLTFGLYPEQACAEGTEIAIYTGQNFEIRTDLDALKSCLPIKTGVDNASKLYLKETEAPTNYDIDMTIHTVSISKKETMYLDAAKDTYVAKVTYGITIDNQSSIVITNKIHIDSNGEEGNTTITGTEGIATGGNDGDSVIAEENGNITTGGKENSITTEEGGGTTATGNDGNGTTGGENGKTTNGGKGETSATGMKRDAGAKHSSPRLGAEKTNTNKNNEISGMQAEDIIEPEVQMNWVTSVLQKTVDILTTVLELLANILHIGFLTF